MHYVYLLKSEKTQWIYIGYTTDIDQRVLGHNSGNTKYTSNRGPWELIYYEAFKSKKDAINRERSLKNYGNLLGLLKKRIETSLKGAE